MTEDWRLSETPLESKRSNLKTDISKSFTGNREFADLIRFYKISYENMMPRILKDLITLANSLVSGTYDGQELQEFAKLIAFNFS